MPAPLNNRNARRKDKSLGRSFTEIAEILTSQFKAAGLHGVDVSQVEWAYETGMRKLRAENPENGRFLLGKINSAGREYAKVTSWKPQSGQGEAGGRFESGIPQIEESEPAREELPEEIYVRD